MKNNIVIIITMIIVAVWLCFTVHITLNTNPDLVEKKMVKPYPQYQITHLIVGDPIHHITLRLRKRSIILDS